MKIRHFQQLHAGRHEQEAGTPRSGDATGRDCRRPPTVATFELRRRNGGGGGMSLDLPLIFAALMGVAVLAYVVLDGYDLGVGMLMPAADAREQELMVSSIGPFWDANETWLVLGVGILLVAFPVAHGVVLGALYLPVATMLIGLMLRGVAFEFLSLIHISEPT